MEFKKSIRLQLGLYLFILLVSICAVSAASTNKGAYIHHNMRTVDYERIQIIEELGFTVDIIRDTDLASYDLDNYEFFVVNDNYLSNPEDVPVYEHKMIIMNYNYIDDWHLATTTYQVTSSHKLQGVVTDPTHFITQGIPTNFDIYTQCCDGTNIPAYYLSRRNSATSVRRILSSPYIETTDAIIGTLLPGDRVRDGVIVNAKTVFFGIGSTEFMTPTSKLLFERSILWLSMDETAPVISNLVVIPGYTTANVSFTTDDMTNTTIRYGITSLSSTYTDSDRETDHLHTLNGLTPESTYNMNLTVCNNANVCTTASTTFTTTGLPAPSNPGNLKIRVVTPTNYINLSWDNDEEIVRYNIYISGSPDIGSFNFNTPSASTTEDQYIDTSAPSYQQRYYVVRAEDTFGNEDENVFVVGKYDIHLKQGINFVSLPLIVQENLNSVKEVMHQNAGYQPVLNVMAQSSSSPDMYLNTVFSTTSANFWSGDFNTMENNKGYLFNSSYETDFTIVGIKPAGIYKQLHLAQGMNLVGFSILESGSINTLLKQTPANYIVSEISRRSANPALMSFDIATFYPMFSPNYFYSNQGFNSIEPGKAYWIKARNAGTISYN